MKNVTYAFIDSQNLNLGVRKAGWNLDFAKFRNYLRTKYDVTKAFLFIGYVPGNESLYKNLQEQGYILVHKPVMEITQADGSKTYKGNVDAEMVLHSMMELPNYSKAVIVSGDGDFYCLVEQLDNLGRLSKVIVPNQRYSSLLRKYAQYVVPLEGAKRKLAYTVGKPKRAVKSA